MVKHQVLQKSKGVFAFLQNKDLGLPQIKCVALFPKTTFWGVEKLTVLKRKIKRHLSFLSFQKEREKYEIKKTITYLHPVGFEPTLSFRSRIMSAVQSTTLPWML